MVGGVSDPSGPSSQLAWALDEMRRSKSLSLVLDDTWYVVSMQWFKIWTKFAEASRSNTSSSNGSNLQSPGPIDNSALTEPSSPGALRRHLIDEMDFVLVPANVYAVLKEMYGTTGPEFPRKVTNMTSGYSSKTIDVYPITYRIFFCKGGELPTGAPMLMQTHSKYTSIEDVDKSIMKEVDSYLLSGGIATSISRRVWVRDSEHSASSVLEPLSYPSKGIDIDRASKPRSLTRHFTDRIGTFWLPLASVDVGPYDYPKGVIDLMIELLAPTASSQATPSATSGKDAGAITAAPARAGLLDLWLQDLREGDSIDASDSQGKWYEARIVHVAADGSLKVHFKAWSAKFDEHILHVEVPKRIAPLYSMTPDWRSALKSGDRLDILTSGPDAPASWDAATVTAINFKTGVIHVKVFGSSELRQVSIESDAICPLRTHSKAPKSESALETSSALTTGSPSFMSKATSFMTKTYDSMKSSSSYSSWGGGGGGKSHELGHPSQPGAVGLRNLGNTCFMNSMLQCLSHAESLTEVFVSGRHVDQLNRTNVLGMGGRVAEEYGSLIQDIWSNKYSVVTPSTFKATIGKFQPQFAGYQQQDSQEFMLFLLDGLHEDMNRVQKKVAVEKVESNGRPDSIISREAWRRFLLRNDSEIVDRLFGQLKSHVTCRNCGHESVTFDEFNSLSLPIPVKNMRHITVTVFLQPFGSVPIMLDVAVEVTGSVRDLKKAVIGTLRSLRLYPRSLSADGYVKQLNSSQSPLAGRKRDFGETNLSHSNSSNSDSSVVIDNDSSSVGASNSDGSEVADEVYQRLHVCALAMFSKKITANLQDESPIQDVTKTAYQSILVYELEHISPVLDDKEYAFVGNRNYNMNYYKHSKHPSSPATEMEPTDLPKHRFVDLIFVRNRSPPQNTTPTATTSNFYNYTVRSGGGGLHGSMPQYQTISLPVRTTFELGAVSYAQFYHVIEDFVLGHIPFDSSMKSFSRRAAGSDSNPESASPNAKVPMRVFLMNHDGLCSDKEYPYLSNEPITAVFQKNSLTILLSDDLIAETTGACSVITSLNARLKYLPSAHRLSDVCEIDFDGTTGSASLRPLNGEADPSYLSLLNENAGSKVRTYKEIDITMCLDKFVEREAMPEEETWYCPKCKQHKAPFKKFDIWAAPEILIIQLKRFQFIPGSYFVHREKINDQVVFPERGLDLGPYLQGQGQGAELPPPIYDLFAVSEHSGGLGGGHYTAICKTPGTEDWYNYNDSYVSKASTDQLVTPQAYVLFYKRRCTAAFRWAGIVPLKEGELPPDSNLPSDST